MRCFGWSLAIVLITALIAPAQAPTLNPAGQKPPNQPPAAAIPPGTPAAPTGNRLDAILLSWETSMKGVESLVAPVRLTEVDDVTKTSEVFDGQIKFLRPNRADLYVAKTSNPQLYKRYLCSGNYLYDFSPREKRIRAYPLQQRAAGQQVVDNTFIGFLAGMSAQEAKRRFDLKLVTSPKNPAGEDQWYAYIQVEPRTPEDKAEFSVARIALLKSTMMPREMQFVAPNGAVSKWEVGTILTNAASQLKALDFVGPQKAPAGWTMEMMPPPGPPGGPPANTPPQPPPSKVRPQGQ
jgi:TIGR03009 family protein